MATEEWRPAPGHEGYDVSSHGRVRSWLPWRGTEVPRIISPVVRQDGRLAVVLSTPRRRTRRKVHQLVAEAFLGPRPDGQETRHLDGDHQHNAVANLAYGSPSDNRQDQMRHGTHPQVVKTHCPKGHMYDAANTYLDGEGHRRCRSCWTARNHARAERKVLAHA